MCVARPDVIVTFMVLVDRHSVHRHPVLRLKATTGPMVVMYVDSLDVTVTSIVLVGRHLAQHHHVLSLTRTIDLEVVMFVGGLAVIAETTQTNA